MRRLGTAPFWVVLAALAGALLVGGSARAGMRWQEATPEAPPAAATAPVANVATAAPEGTAPPAATPAAEAEATAAPAAAATDVVTLVAWYALDPSGEFLSVYPVQTTDGFVAGQGGEPIGRVEFPEGVPPVIVVGDSRFDGYPRSAEDDPTGQRWTWFNDEDGRRPATLVVQVAGVEGTYSGYFGTATFVSRDEGSAGGVLVLALRPPTEQPAEEAPAEEAPAEGDEAA